MRRSANVIPAALVALSLTTLVKYLMDALSSYFHRNSHSLKLIYTVAVESFEKLVMNADWRIS